MLRLSLTALAAILVLASPAFAQDTTVAVGGVVDTVVGLISVIVTGAIAAGIFLLKPVLDNLVGVRASQEMRNALEAGLMWAVEKARGDIVERYGAVTVDTRSELAAAAADYVIPKFQDTIAAFDLTEDDVRDMVLARIGVSFDEARDWD